MAPLSYLDFDLLIDQGKTGYRAQVLSAPSGADRATVEFTLPFDEKDIKILLLSMGQRRRNTRRMESSHTEEAKKFGGKLFDAVFTKDLWACLRRSMEIAQRQDAGLRIRLQLTRDAQNLADLPWEYLYDEELNRFLALSTETPVTRYLALPEPPRPLTIQPPLRVLVMISSPTDYPALDVEREWSVLQEALQDVQRDGLVIAERLERPSLAALQRRLRRGQYHVFHFIGHGAFDEATQDGVLLLEDDDRRGYVVSGQELGTLLHDHRPLRLSIINACEGARSARSDPFAGTAQSLVQQGVPAVIAMQFEISDEAAIAFSHEFYGALVDGYPVDGALAEARKSIFSRSPDVEWGTPVLFMRSPDGRIFDVAPVAPAAAAPAAAAPAAPAPAPAQPQASTPPPSDARRSGDPIAVPPAAPPAAQRSVDLESRYTQALEDFYTEKWEQAVGILEEIVAVQPKYPGAAEKLEHARRQLTLSADYTAALQALAGQSWSEAADHLDGIVRLDPGYRDARNLLATARKNAELAGLYAEARQLSRGKAWQAIARIFDRIHAQDPAYPDPDGLLTTASASLAAIEQDQQVANLYRQGMLDLDAGRMREAIAAFEQVSNLTPGYKQTDALLERSRAAVVEEERRRREEAEAALQQTLADAFARGLAALEAGQWGAAVADLRVVVGARPDYVDPIHGRADELLARAQQQKELSAMPPPKSRGKPKDLPK